MRTGTRTLSVARRLRREMTAPELLLWLKLKQPSDHAPRFRRQHAMGAYVLDFYAPAAKLVVAVDGASHSMGDQPARDETRDAWLVQRGLEVVRIPASDVLANTDDVVDGLMRLAAACASPPPSRR